MADTEKADTEEFPITENELGKLRHDSDWAEAFPSRGSLAGRASGTQDIEAYHKALQRSAMEKHNADLVKSKDLREAQALVERIANDRAAHNLKEREFDFKIAQAKQKRIDDANALARKIKLEEAKAEKDVAEKKLRDLREAKMLKEATDKANSETETQLFHDAESKLAKDSGGRDKPKYRSGIVSLVNQFEHLPAHVSGPFIQHGLSSEMKLPTPPKPLNPWTVSGRLGAEIARHSRNDAMHAKEMASLEKANPILLGAKNIVEYNGKRYFGTGSASDKARKESLVTPESEAAYNRYNELKTKRQEITDAIKPLQDTVDQVASTGQLPSNYQPPAHLAPEMQPAQEPEQEEPVSPPVAPVVTPLVPPAAPASTQASPTTPVASPTAPVVSTDKPVTEIIEYGGNKFEVNHTTKAVKPL